MANFIEGKLKALRKEKGWSQEQTADFLCISQSAYARMEGGGSNSWATSLTKICEVFEIQPEELIKSEKLIIGNLGTNHGVGYAEVVNQLSDKLIEQYEQRLKQKDELIALLKQKS